jgi:shikimate kinase
VAGDKREVVSLLFLVGMPGAGKSYWAQAISKACGLEFVDMDEFIEQREGKSIANIFQQHGKVVFREKERDVLATIVENKTKTVVACGGGTPCYFNNLQLMLQTGTVIYLQASINNLINNLSHEEHLRPMLAGKRDIKEFLEGLLKEREGVYEKAHYILDADTVSLANFTKILDDV